MHAKALPRTGPSIHLMQRLLITGRNGFVGSAVSRYLARDGCRIGWEAVDLPTPFDLRDRAATARFVAHARPDAVLHLAAQSAVPESFRDPVATIEVNVLGTLHLLQALAASGFAGRFVHAGTGDVYGLVPEADLPVGEAWLPRPRNPYAVSKLASEALCWQWYASERMDVVLARAFNHIGWGQSDRFAIASFARQLVEIRRGARVPVITTGDLDVTRDFTDVDDVAAAYFALLARGAAGEVYNVCSGVERRIGDLLQQMIDIARVEVTLEEDALRLRASEQRRMRGDAGKILAATGWQVVTPIEVSLRSALDYWEGQARQ